MICVYLITTISAQPTTTTIKYDFKCTELKNGPSCFYRHLPFTVIFNVVLVAVKVSVPNSVPSNKMCNFGDQEIYR